MTTTQARPAETGRYPVKGLGGESLREAFLGRDGLRFDRLLGLANDMIPLENFGSWTTFCPGRSWKRCIGSMPRSPRRPSDTLTLA